VQDEGHALTVVRALEGMCCREPGAAAAHAAGLIPHAEAALVSAKGLPLRCAALDLLRAAAQQCEPARAAMRDGAIITTAAKLLAGGVADTREAGVASSALRLLLALSETASLRLAIQKIEPFEPLRKVCEASAAQRNEALMLLVNVYAENLQLTAAEGVTDEVRSVTLLDHVCDHSKAEVPTTQTAGPRVQ